HIVLCIKFKANQVISGVVVNILAAALTSFLTKRLNESLFSQTSNKFVLGTSIRFSIPVLSEIPVIGGIFTNIYPFEVMIVVIAVIMWFVMYRSPFGMHLRACGDNPHAADAAGINVNRVRTAAVMISGGLSAIAGMSFAYSISANFSPDIYLGYGYLSIAALIFGNWSILPTLGACMIFGFARSGGQALIQQLGMPSTFNDLVRILRYVLTLFLLIFFSKHNNAPRALGEIYDKGKR
ncbi:MAG: ABC transporter permease, partial [Ruminiclostridium sp.]|nr:ABC transporter permease [Ruminiclostridium sp.]